MGGCLPGGYDIQGLDSGLSDTLFRAQPSRQYSAQAGGTFHGKELMDGRSPQVAINQQRFHSPLPGSGQRQKGAYGGFALRQHSRGEKQRLQLDRPLGRPAFGAVSPGRLRTALGVSYLLQQPPKLRHKGQLRTEKINYRDPLRRHFLLALFRNVTQHGTDVFILSLHFVQAVLCPGEGGVYLQRLLVLLNPLLP